MCRVRLEYDRLKAELDSLKAEISNSVQVYQDFCDRNIELKKREDELLHTIGELEAKRTELQKIRLNESSPEFQESNRDNYSLRLEAAEFIYEQF
jgi:hypothetical protein